MKTVKGDFIIGSGNYTEYRYRPDDQKDYVENTHAVATLLDREDSFYSKYGMKAIELAKEEGVSTDAINMRVHLYGTPFQRKAKPTLCEQIHNKTDYELGLELNIHPQSIRRKVRLYGTAYYENPRQTHPLRGKVISTKKDWRANAKKTKFWLHPKHPDYPHADREGL